MLDQKRMKILTTLSNLEIMTRSQIQTLHNTKSIRNTNFIMQSLKPYTNSIRLKENAYYLNKKGAALIGTKKQFKYNDQVQHKLMRNDAYIYFKPREWYPERKFLKPIEFIPDAFFYSGSSYKFLEVDNVQTWKTNVEKMNVYKDIKNTGAFQIQYGKFPTIVWVVRYEVRKDKIKKLAKELDLFCEVYLHDEIRM